MLRVTAVTWRLFHRALAFFSKGNPKDWPADAAISTLSKLNWAFYSTSKNDVVTHRDHWRPVYVHGYKHTHKNREKKLFRYLITREICFAITVTRITTMIIRVSIHIFTINTRMGQTQCVCRGYVSCPPPRVFVFLQWFLNAPLRTPMM